MRRMMLAVTGGVTGSVMLLVFACAIACQILPARAAEQSPALRFPCQVTGTELKVWQAEAYLGPFWEDRSRERVVDTVVLLVENTGILPVAQGAVILEWGSHTLVFEIYALPPGEKLLVLEKDAQTLPKGLPDACYGWTTTEYPEYLGCARVEDAGVNALAVINPGTEVLPEVRICYKRRDPDSGMYIGGTAYTVELWDLRPGERRVIIPEHYLSGSTQVVSVLVCYR